MGFENRKLLRGDPSVPYRCEECGSNHIKYQGVGSYICEDCRHEMFDDYGKVRNYLDAQHGATLHDAAMATGVPQNKIRQLIREERFEIAANSAVFMRCEMCGADIRSGRYCDECLKVVFEQEAMLGKRAKSKNIHGYGAGNVAASGAKRFHRSEYK